MLVHVPATLSTPAPHVQTRLQEWVPGGELFHHLDVEGSFGDAAACFYAANVLLALQVGGWPGLGAVEAAA